MYRLDIYFKTEPELAVITHEFAADEALFLSELGKAWSLLMNADMFDGPRGNLCSQQPEPTPDTTPDTTPDSPNTNTTPDSPNTDTTPDSPNTDTTPESANTTPGPEPETTPDNNSGYKMHLSTVSIILTLLVSTLF